VLSEVPGQHLDEGAGRRLRGGRSKALEASEKPGKPPMTLTGRDPELLAPGHPTHQDHSQVLAGKGHQPVRNLHQDALWSASISPCCPLVEYVEFLRGRHRVRRRARMPPPQAAGPVGSDPRRSGSLALERQRQSQQALHARLRQPALGLGRAPAEDAGATLPRSRPASWKMPRRRSASGGGTPWLCASWGHDDNDDRAVALAY
jgi:hypothetical protein